MPEIGKIRAVTDFHTPKTKKDVREFWGMVGYYHRFVPGFADIVACLSDLTWKEAPNKVLWTEAFQTLKESLLKKPVLRCPDYSKMFILQSDASG